MISRNQGLKLVVNVLFSAIPAITNVIVIIVLFLIIFSIVGVNLYKGLFYYC